jgi:hypothetical protein
MCVKRFISELEWRQRIQKITNNVVALEVLTTLLTRRGSDLIKHALKRNPDLKYEEAKSMLLQCFKDKQKGAKIRDEMDSLRLKVLVADHNLEIMLLAEKISNMGAGDLCHHYQIGLKGEIYKRVAMSGEETD